MRKHLLAMVTIGLSVGACDEAVNIDCGEDGCRFSEGECQNDETRCLSNGRGFLKCKDGYWKDVELCSDSQTCNSKTNQCEAPCREGLLECLTENGPNAFQKCQAGQWITGTCEEGQICQETQCITEESDECEGDLSECISESSYHECIHKKWNTVTCEAGKTCQNGHCVQTEPGVCEEGKRRCVANDVQQYETCQNNQWVPDRCKDELICKEGICVPNNPNECEDGKRRCVASDAQQYEVCQNNQWVLNSCENEHICKEGDCVNKPEDCEDGKFIECIENNTKKIVQTCNPKGENIVPCSNGTICSAENQDCIASTPPTDPCAYENIKDELDNAISGCDMAKTFIVSSSTDLAQLDNWHEGEKSCLVFCDNIALDGLKDSIPLPKDSQIVGVNRANLKASALSKPLFKGKDGTTIVSNIFKNLKVDVTKLMISEDGAHGILANKAEAVTVENVTLTGNLEHANNELIENVGGLFGSTKLKSTISNTNLNSVTIQLNAPSNFDNKDHYNKCVAGFIGEASGDVEITGSRINGLTIHAGYARHVGGMVGRPLAKFTVSGSFNFDKDHIQYDITDYDVSKLTILKATYYAGGLVGKAESASLNIKNMAIQIDTIQSYLKGAAGIAGDIRKSDNGNNPELVITDLYLKVSDQIKAGECAAGIAGTLKESKNLNIKNVISKINQIDAIKQNEFTYDTPDGDRAGGLFGSIVDQQSDGIIGNVYLIANHIQSAEYVGGFIGRLQTGNNHKIDLNTISNFAQEITANENSGGVIGSIGDDFTININTLQNIVLTLKTTANDTYPGGVIGPLTYKSDNYSYYPINSITITNIATYSRRYINTETGMRQRAIVADNNCNQNTSLFTNAVFLDDYHISYKNNNSIACGNIYSYGGLSRIGSGNECDNNYPTNFICKKVKVDDKTSITIPLFAPSMLDGENIQW